MDKFKDNNDSVLIEQFKFWQNKEVYLELLEQFIDEKIDVIQFDLKLAKMRRNDLDGTRISKKFLTVSPTVNLDKVESFVDLISYLFVESDACEPDPYLRKEYEISEDQLRELVREAIIKIKNDYS